MTLPTYTLARKDALARHFLSTGAAKLEVADLIANGGLNPAYRDNPNVEGLVADAMAARAVMVGGVKSGRCRRFASAALRPYGLSRQEASQGFAALPLTQGAGSD